YTPLFRSTEAGCPALVGYDEWLLRMQRRLEHPQVELVRCTVAPEKGARPRGGLRPAAHEVGAAVPGIRRPTSLNRIVQHCRCDPAHVVGVRGQVRATR